MPNYKVIETVRVRMAPSLKARTLVSADGADMYLPQNGTIRIESTIEREGHLWARYFLEGGDLQLAEAWSCVRRLRDGMTWLKPVDEIIIRPSEETFAQKARRIIGIHDLCCGGAADSARIGASVVKVFNDATGAAQVAEAYPGALVVHRRYFTQPISARDLLAQHGIDPSGVNHKLRILVETHNENDINGFGTSVEEIRRRAAYAREMLALMSKAAPNCMLLDLNVAHGTPDITKPEICKVLRDEYAPLYNSGRLWVGQHNYFKSDPNNPKNYRFYGHEWFDTRWRWFFTHCGFDPRIRHILPSESGGECGHGGMKWAGFSHEEMFDWIKYQVAIQTEPIVVDNKVYPSPVAGCTIFQRRGVRFNSWGGYEMEDYMSVVERAYNYVPPRDGEATDVTTSMRKAPKGYVPPKKVIEAVS